MEFQERHGRREHRPALLLRTIEHVARRGGDVRMRFTGTVESRRGELVVQHLLVQLIDGPRRIRERERDIVKSGLLVCVLLFVKKMQEAAGQEHARRLLKVRAGARHGLAVGIDDDMRDVLGVAYFVQRP